MSTSKSDLQRDLQLWRQAAAGDRIAQQRLVERAWLGCSQRLRVFDADARDDVRQQIAESLLTALATGVEPHENLDGLLQWRARGVITDFVRRQIKLRRLQGADEILSAVGYEAAPFDRAESSELREILDACIEAVPNQNHRSAYALRVRDGLRPREIAERLGGTAHQIGVWLARAAALVRDCVSRKLSSGGRG